MCQRDGTRRKGRSIETLFALSISALMLDSKSSLVHSPWHRSLIFFLVNAWIKAVHAVKAHGSTSGKKRKMNTLVSLRVDRIGTLVFPTQPTRPLHPMVRLTRVLYHRSNSLSPLLKTLDVIAISCVSVLTPKPFLRFTSKTTARQPRLLQPRHLPNHRLHLRQCHRFLERWQ